MLPFALVHLGYSDVARPGTGSMMPTPSQILEHAGGALTNVDKDISFQHTSLAWVNGQCVDASGTTGWHQCD